MDGVFFMSRKALKIIQENEAVTIAEARNDYLAFCRARNLANATILNNEKATRYFMDFLGADFNIYDITKQDVTNYVLDCLTRVQGNTARSYCKVLKTFFSYFELDIEITMPSETFKYKEIYTDEEITLLLQPPKRKSYTALRDYALICFLLSTGVRGRTLVNIKIKDLYFDNNLIFLDTTKTKKQYYIPMSTQLKKVLKQYLAVWKHREEDYLFPNQFGEQLGKKGLGCLIARYNKSRGVETRGVHRFRNTYATNYVKNNGNVFRLQQLLGHSKIETTRRYVTINVEDLKLNYDEYNILDVYETNRIKKKVHLNKRK